MNRKKRIAARFIALTACMLAMAMIPVNAQPNGKFGSVTVRRTLDVRGFSKDSIRVNGRAVKMTVDFKHGAGEYFRFDCDGVKEVSGMILRWDEMLYPRVLTVFSTMDSVWKQTATIRYPFGGVHEAIVPKMVGRSFLIECSQSPKGESFALKSIELLTPEEAGDAKTFVRTVASREPGRRFPQFIRGERPQASAAHDSASPGRVVATSDGISVLATPRFMVSPFLLVGKRLADPASMHAKIDAENPGTVTMTDGQVNVRMSPKFATVNKVRCLVIRTQVENRGASVARGRLFLALRPYAFDDSVQVGEVRRLVFSHQRFDLDGTSACYVVRKPQKVGVCSPNSGDITTFLERGIVPADPSGFHISGLMSGAAEYSIALKKGASEAYDLVVPLQAIPPQWTPANAKEGSKLSGGRK